MILYQDDHGGQVLVWTTWRPKVSQKGKFEVSDEILRELFACVDSNHCCHVIILLLLRRVLIVCSLYLATQLPLYTTLILIFVNYHLKVN